MPQAKRNTMELLLVLLLRAVASAELCNGGGQYDTYEEACEAIIECGQTAARAFNTKSDDPTRYLKEAEGAFAAATRMENKEAQAFANMATLQLNTHQFERAIENWRETISRLPKESRALAWAKEREHYSRLGHASAMRDNAYAQRNMSAALAWTMKQRALVPMSPRVAYDLATLHATADEADLAELEYALSQQYATSAASSFYFDNAKKFTLLNSAVDETKIVSIGQAFIAGPDGVVIQRSQLFIHIDAPWIPIHANLWLDERFWRPDAPGKTPYDHSKRRRFMPSTSLTDGISLRFDRAASVLCFAASNFYHLLTDVIPRLIFFLEVEKTDPSMKIIVPEVSNRLWRLYELATNLSPTTIARLHPVTVEASATAPGPRIEINDLHMIKIPRVTASDGRPTHSLTPAPLLRAAQKHLLRTIFPNQQSTAPLRILYASRRGVSSRRFQNESILLDALRTHLTETDVYDFDGSDTDIEASIRLFNSATVVLGVHGAGLANILFCTPENTKLVIELGFPHAHARHYEHMATSLNLPYRRILLESHGAAFAAKSVALSQESINLVLENVRKAVTTIQQEQIKSLSSSPSSSSSSVDLTKDDTTSAGALSLPVLNDEL